MKPQHVDAICRLEQKIENMKVTAARINQEYETEDGDSKEEKVLMMLERRLNNVLEVCDEIREMR